MHITIKILKIQNFMIKNDYVSEIFRKTCYHTRLHVISKTIQRNVLCNRSRKMVLCKFSRIILNGLPPDDLDKGGPHSLIWILCLALFTIEKNKAVFIPQVRRMSNSLV